MIMYPFKSRNKILLINQEVLDEVMVGTRGWNLRIKIAKKVKDISFVKPIIKVIKRLK